MQPLVLDSAGTPLETDPIEAAKETIAVDGALSIKVLGAGCASCHTLPENTKEAILSMGLDVAAEYVIDIISIAGYRCDGVQSVWAEGVSLTNSGFAQRRSRQ